MALIEADSILRGIDENGNPIIMYPATRKDNIIDLERATTEEDGLLPSSDKSKLDKTLFVLGQDANGIYMESLVDDNNSSGE